MASNNQFVMWWEYNSWEVKLYAALIAGSLGITILLSAAVIFPVWLFEVLFT